MSFNRWISDNSEPDRKMWEAWLKKNKEKKAIADEAASILKGIQFKKRRPHSNAHIEKQLSFLHNSIAEKEVTQKSPKQLFSNLFRNNFLALAAAVLLVFATIFVVNFFLYNPLVQNQTAFGEIITFELPDGSSVTLNANSTLSYEKDHPRKVWLDGEAYFEVTKKPKTKENFQVLTNDLSIKVLGTSFNVNSRYSQTKVYLEEGSVVLEVAEMDTPAMEMSPGELASYSKKTNSKLEKRIAKKLENTSWKSGVIRFTEVPLSTALQEISTIYGIQFDVIDQELNQQLFSGGIPNSNLDIALATLQEVYGLSIKPGDGDILRVTKIDQHID